MFTARRVSFLLLLLIVFTLLIVPVASAQDVGVPVAPGAQADLAAALAALLELVSNITFLPFAALFVVAATALLKKVLPSSISAGAIALTVQVLVWAAYVAAKQFGYEGQFTSGLEALTTILGAIAGLVGSSLVATRVYQQAEASGVPVLGDARTPRPPVLEAIELPFSQPDRAFPPPEAHG